MPDTNLIFIANGQERFAFIYDDESHSTLLQTVGRYASDPDIQFSWHDAAIVSQKARRLMTEAKLEGNR